MRIAVVGSGISGLGVAHLLNRAHDVTVFERDTRAGGHSHTIVHDGLALDTGFLVHNTRNYPLLVRLLAELGVRTQESDMSFSVGCASCGLEYSGRRPFAQRRNTTSPRFAALLWEIGRWLRTARRSLDETDYEHHSLEAYLDERRYSLRFRRHFLVPLTSALWSTAPGRALEFPAAYAIRFFDNHGMLGVRRFAWRTVTGGADTYVRALSDRLGPRLHLGLGARSVRRDAGGIELTTDDGERHRFDRIVIATHADQALALLEDPSEEESRVLGAFGYTRNEAVLHTDQRLLPRARSARAAWNYRLGDDGRPTVTYSLNRLQSLQGETEYCVTLNETVDDEHVIRRLVYEHPLYTVESLRAQRELP
ncbi:MAG: NAD(P)/FAD-dependent oxidoreductase, partial [Gaiellaceae bacterium]